MAQGTRHGSQSCSRAQKSSKAVGHTFRCQILIVGVRIRKRLGVRYLEDKDCAFGTQLSTGWLFTWKLPAPSPARTGNRGDLRQGKEKKREDRGRTGAGASQAVVGVEYRQGGRGRILKMKKKQKGAIQKWLFCGENIPCGNCSLPGGTNSPDGKPAREGEGSSKEQAGTCRAARKYPQAFHGQEAPASRTSSSCQCQC